MVNSYSRNFSAAIKAAKTLKVDWDIPQENLISTDDLLLKQKLINDKANGAVIYDEGSFEEGLSNSKQKHGLYIVLHLLLTDY